MYVSYQLVIYLPIAFSSIFATNLPSCYFTKLLATAQCLLCIARIYTYVNCDFNPITVGLAPKEIATTLKISVVCDKLTERTELFEINLETLSLAYSVRYRYNCFTSEEINWNNSVETQQVKTTLLVVFSEITSLVAVLQLM